ncbi:MAG TPA: FAD-dependent monooxygenase, partial [Solirubrobacteraceae bacterium]|nr:FAD-dependent monooxygenase [Solirubrobacteraceae bacterium]
MDERPRRITRPEPARADRIRYSVRVVTTEPRLTLEGEPTLRDLSAALVAAFGTDFGAHDPTWISRFTDATRQAAAYRDSRVLLAGDAAHVHYPAGGPGPEPGGAGRGQSRLETRSGGGRDVTGDAAGPAERHPVGARALRHTMAQTALQRGDDRTLALVEVVAELAAMDEPRRRLAGIVSGLSIHYDLGEGHPLLG